MGIRYFALASPTGGEPHRVRQRPQRFISSKGTLEDELTSRELLVGLCSFPFGYISQFAITIFSTRIAGFIRELQPMVIHL